MAPREHRRVVNQMGYHVPETDRMFALAIRRLLLRVIAMLEERYALRPVNPDRETVTSR